MVFKRFGAINIAFKCRASGSHASARAFSASLAQAYFAAFCSRRGRPGPPAAIAHHVDKVIDLNRRPPTDEPQPCWADDGWQADRASEIQQRFLGIFSSVSSRR